MRRIRVSNVTVEVKSVQVKRHPTKYMGEEYHRLVSENLNWEIKELQTASEPICTVDGKKVIMLCANNYLNLATHPRVVNAMIEATRQYGAGAGSDRSIAGNMTLHEELDRRLAGFKRAPASLTYQTGFMANEGLVPQLCGKGDLFVSDEMNVVVIRRRLVIEAEFPGMLIDVFVRDIEGGNNGRVLEAVVSRLGNVAIEADRVSFPGGILDGFIELFQGDVEILVTMPPVCFNLVFTIFIKGFGKGRHDTDVII